MPFNLSTGELLVLGIVAVLVFGGRLPDVARKVGRTLGDIKRGMREEIRRLDVEERPPAPAIYVPPDGQECDGGGDPEDPRAEPSPDLPASDR